MLSSPAKRRRSNSSSAIPVNVSDTAQRPASNDASSPFRKRASFQSPTKASLARSHPEVLSRVLSRSPPKSAKERPGSRGKGKTSTGGSWEDTLGIRSNRPLRPSLTGPIHFPARPSDPNGRTSGSPRRGSSVPVQAFAAPPRRQSQRGRVSQSADLSERPERAVAAQPEEQTDSPNEQLASELGSATKASEPNGIPPHPESPGLENGEPGLPPTPTELGLEKAPDRSRGLLSSSSPSWRQEKRKTRRSKEDVKSSPLKPRNADRALKRGREESPSRRRPEGHENVPSEIREKQKLRDELAAQLARLKNDISQLENEARRQERPADFPPLDQESVGTLIELLTTKNPSCAPPTPAPEPPRISSLLSFLLPFSSSRHIPKPEPDRPLSPPPKNEFALEQPTNLTPYLTIFAPLSLAVHTTTAPSFTTTSSDSFNQNHRFLLSAPAPFPSRVFEVPITLRTDPQRQSVLSISIPPDPTLSADKGGGFGIPSTLRSWMTTRLESPLLELDISGLCWGVNRYWEAAVSRAKIWVQLEKLLTKMREPNPSRARKQSSIDVDAEDDDLQGESKYTPQDLIPHLDRTSLLFFSPQSSRQTRLLVTCQLTLDLWTSEPELQPDISLSIPLSNGAKIEREAKKIFTSMLKGGATNTSTNGDIDSDASLLVKAVHGVVGVVFEDN